MRNLDRRIDLERTTGSYSPSGQPIDTWSAIEENLPAAYKPVSAAERYSAEQFVARQQVEFTIRWSPNVADLSPVDRVVYPSASGSPETPEVYDIIEVAELGRREGLKIIAARRAEE